MFTAARRVKTGFVWAIFPIFWGVIFWTAVCREGRVPLMAQFQAAMAPWAAEAPAPTDKARQWDSLLWDGVAQFYPWRLLLHEAAQRGELPLWNPHQFCGYPFVGNGQSAIFYPPNWLYFIVPPLKGLAISAALHSILAGLFTFGLCRCLGLRREACALSAVTFALGGFMVSWVQLPTLTNCATWLPLALWGIELARLRRTGRAVATIGLALGMTLLAGHMQIAAYVWLTTAVYAALRLGAGKVHRRREKLAVIGCGFALGILLGAAQLLPTFELGGLSPRGSGQPTEAGYQFHVERALKPLELITLAFPNALGSPARGDYPGISYSEHCGFVGALTLILAAFALLLRRDRATFSFGLIALFCLLVVLGSPLARLLYFGVPKVGLTGGFTRLLSVYTLCAAVLGGLGLDRLLRLAEGPGVARLAAFAFISWLPWLAAVEVFGWGVGFLPATKAEGVYAETALTRELRSLPPGRVLAITPRANWQLGRAPEALLPPNSATVYGLQSVQGYDSLYPMSVRAWAAKAEGADPSPLANGNMLLLERWASAAYDSAALRYVITSSPVQSDLLRCLGQYDGVYLYERRTALPRARIAGAGARAAGMQTPALQLADSGCNALKIALPPGTQGQLFIADTYYPGWLAYADGRPVEVHASRDDATFRTLDLAAPASDVRMIYYPRTVQAGVFLMLCALAVIVGLFTSAGGARILQ